MVSKSTKPTTKPTKAAPKPTKAAPKPKPRQLARGAVEEALRGATPPAPSADFDPGELPAVAPRWKYGKRADRVAPRERALRALALYKLGLNYEQIAQQLQLDSRRRAWELIQGLLKKYELDGVREARLVVGDQLRDLYRVVIPRALGGDLDAVRVALSIHDRYTRLMGLNMEQGAEPLPEGSMTITIVPRPPDTTPPPGVTVDAAPTSPTIAPPLTRTLTI